MADRFGTAVPYLRDRDVRSSSAGESADSKDTNDENAYVTNLIETKYTITHADDEFLTQSGVLSCIKTLENDLLLLSDELTALMGGTSSEIELSGNPAVVLIAGLQGSGKTTLIRLLCRLYEPQKGNIYIDGQNIRNISIQSLRNQLGVVLQDTFLFSGNVADNLRLDSFVDDQHLKDICSELGLDNLLSKLPNGLETYIREVARTGTGSSKEAEQQKADVELEARRKEVLASFGKKK